MTVGGRLDGGETPSEAAIRELREETGIVASSTGDCVCRWDAICPWDDEIWHFHEHFFVIRAPAGHDVELIAHTKAEKQNFPLWETRWWNAAELLASDEVFAPPDLGSILRSHLAGRLPTIPINLDGWTRTLG